MIENDKVRHDNNRRQVAGAIAGLLQHSTSIIENLQAQLVAVDALIAEKRKEFHDVIYKSADKTKK